MKSASCWDGRNDCIESSEKDFKSQGADSGQQIAESADDSARFV